jgi:hypothetical protein
MQKLVQKLPPKAAEPILKARLKEVPDDKP